MSGMRCFGSFCRQRLQIDDERRRQTGRQQRPVRLCTNDGRERVGEVVARKRARARQHLEQHRAERPDVRALVHRSAARLLGRHVGGRAENHPDLRHRGRRERRRIRRIGTRAGRRVHRFREPEVEHLHRAVRADFDVRRLQVAMDDALLVRGFEGLRDLLRDRQRVGKRDRAMRDAIGERRALDQLEHERMRRAAVLKAVDGGDVWMVERGEHLRFAPKSRQPVGIGRRTRRAGSSARRRD